MSKDTLRIGIVGAGANTRLHHIPKLRAQPGVEIVAVANRSRASSRRAARELGIPRAAADWLAIVEDEAIDAVCIGTWPYLHAPITIAALEAGKHVLCEARMAMNAGEAHDMLAASLERPDLIAQIVPAPHTLALDRTIADFITAGRLGDLVAVQARITNGAFPNPDTPLHWRQNQDLSGNNIMAMGIWYEAIMRWVGPAETVQAVGQTVVPRRKDASGQAIVVTVPDHIDVLCRMRQGGQMSMTVSDNIGFATGPEVMIHGTEGALRIALGGAGLGLWAGRRGGKALKAVKIPPRKRGGWRVEEEFVNAIRGKETVTHTDFVTAVKYMEWTDAVTESIRTGDCVPLPLV